jgi:hypothetical protein
MYSSPLPRHPDATEVKKNHNWQYYHNNSETKLKIQVFSDVMPC